jgi:hypothetical protein
VAEPSRSAPFAAMGCAVGLVVLAACGGSKPPPKTEEAPTQETSTPSAEATPVVTQELGSIDERSVVETFAKLQMPLEGCLKQGRTRLRFLSGDVKVFLRIEPSGKVKYAFFEDSTLGDRDTEKCILDVLHNADWPKPKGGEAEVRNGFGWEPGGERPPASWESDKVTTALVESKEVKKDIDKCKSGIKGDFHVTAYVEHGIPAPPPPEPGAPKKKPKKPKKPEKKPKKNEKRAEGGGRFKSVGVAPPNKEGAEKVDCLVDALKRLEVPNPGSYAAKVTFSL